MSKVQQRAGGGKVTVEGLAADVVQSGKTVTVKQGSKTVQKVTGSRCLLCGISYCGPVRSRGPNDGSATKYAPVSFADGVAMSGTSGTLTVMRAGTYHCRLSLLCPSASGFKSYAYLNMNNSIIKTVTYAGTSWNEDIVKEEVFDLVLNNGDTLKAGTSGGYTFGDSGSVLLVYQ